MGLIRADRLLYKLGLARSRSHASELIKKGLVYLRSEAGSGDQIDKPSQLLPEDIPKEKMAVQDDPLIKFVSRGGIKLQGALDRLNLEVENLSALDVGSSTGGFTDCLLQNGVKKILAIDSGKDQMTETLRKNERIILREQFNIRDLTREYFKKHFQNEIGEIDLVVMDVSFISIGLVFPVLADIAAPKTRLLSLVKPQFEVGRASLGKGGLVKDKTLYDQVRTRTCENLDRSGWRVLDYFASSIEGGDGNKEFFVFADRKQGDK